MKMFKNQNNKLKWVKVDTHFQRIQTLPSEIIEMVKSFIVVDSKQKEILEYDVDRPINPFRKLNKDNYLIKFQSDTSLSHMTEKQRINSTLVVIPKMYLDEIDRITAMNHDYIIHDLAIGIANQMRLIHTLLEHSVTANQLVMIKATFEYNVRIVYERIHNTEVSMFRSRLIKLWSLLRWWWIANIRVTHHTIREERRGIKDIDIFLIGTVTELTNQMVSKFNYGFKKVQQFKKFRKHLSMKYSNDIHDNLQYSINWLYKYEDDRPLNIQRREELDRLKLILSWSGHKFESSKMYNYYITETISQWNKIDINVMRDRILNLKRLDIREMIDRPEDDDIINYTRFDHHAGDSRIQQWLEELD